MSRGGTRLKKHLCDYPFFLFRADDQDGAFSKALALGRKQEATYKNDEDRDVRWVFVRVEEIWDMGEDIDGVEIGSIMDYWVPEGPVPKNFDFEPEKYVPVFGDKP